MNIASNIQYDWQLFFQPPPEESGPKDFNEWMGVQQVRVDAQADEVLRWEDRHSRHIGFDTKHENLLNYGLRSLDVKQLTQQFTR